MKIKESISILDRQILIQVENNHIGLLRGIFSLFAVFIFLFREDVLS